MKKKTGFLSCNFKKGSEIFDDYIGRYFQMYTQSFISRKAPGFRADVGTKIREELFATNRRTNKPPIVMKANTELFFT